MAMIHRLRRVLSTSPGCGPCRICAVQSPTKRLTLAGASSPMTHGRVLTMRCIKSKLDVEELRSIFAFYELALPLLSSRR